jgi:LysR family transcriptional regulator, mexEF-oprN operon transcriptional activator
MTDLSQTTLRQLRRLDLNLLKLFAVLCKTHNVSRAAELVGLSQPGASQSLARLRTVFRDQLFVRSGQGVAPTVRARQLEPMVLTVLEGAARLLASDAKFEPEQFDGIINIGASDYLALTFYGCVLPQLVSLAPRMRISVRAIDRERVASMLDNHEIDLALGFFPQAQSWHVQDLLFEDNFLCVFNPEWMAFTAPLTLEQYVSVPHVMGSLHGEFESLIDARLAESNVSRHVMVSTSHFLSLIFQVRLAPVLATLPAHIAKHCEHIGGLVTSPVPLDLPHFPTGMLWHERDRDHAPHRWFRELVQTSIQSKATRTQAATPSAALDLTHCDELPG